MRKTRLFATFCAAALSLALPITAGATTPSGNGLIGGVPVTCDDNSTLTVTIVPGGPPGIGPAWFDDGTHTVAQSATLVYDGQVVYQATFGHKVGQQPAITCTGPFPWGDSFAEITVVAVAQP